MWQTEHKIEGGKIEKKTEYRRTVYERQRIDRLCRNVTGIIDSSSNHLKCR